MGSVAYLAEQLEGDLYGYLPGLYKNPLAKLAVMVSAVIEARSCNDQTSINDTHGVAMMSVRVSCAQALAQPYPLKIMAW